MTEEPTHRSLKRPYLLAAPGVLGWLAVFVLLGLGGISVSVITVLTWLTVVCGVLALLVVLWAGFRLRGDDSRPLTDPTIFVLGANGTFVLMWVVSLISSALD